MGGAGGVSNTFRSSLCWAISAKSSLDKASMTTLSVPLMYFKVTPYSSKVSRWQGTWSQENFVDGCITFVWSMWMVTC